MFFPTIWGVLRTIVKHSKPLDNVLWRNSLKLSLKLVCKAPLLAFLAFGGSPVLYLLGGVRKAPCLAHPTCGPSSHKQSLSTEAETPLVRLVHLSSWQGDAMPWWEQ